MEIHDTTTGRLLFTLPGALVNTYWMNQTFITVDTSPQPTTVFTFWDVSSPEGGRQVSSFTAPVSMANGSGGVHLVRCHPGFQVSDCPVVRGDRVWDLTTGQEIVIPAIRALPSNGNPIFNPDGTRVEVVNPDQTLSVLDTATWQEVLKISPPAGVLLVRFSRDGQKIVTMNGNRTITVWDATTGEEIYTLSGERAPNAVALSADGKFLAVGSGSGIVTIWDIHSQHQPFTKVGNQGIDWLDFSPDGTHLSALIQPDDKALIWSLAPQGELLTLVNGSNISGHDTDSVAYSPDGQRLVVGFGNAATVWDATTGRQLFTLSGHTDRVENVAWSPDGARIATASDDKTAILWDASTGQSLFTLSTPYDPVFSVAFSLDGSRLATSGSGYSDERVWDTATGQQLLNRNDDNVDRGIAWSPDGREIITAT